MISQAVGFLTTRVDFRPRIGVVLGSGLGAFADELAGPVAIPYAEIPGLPQPTVAGHSGRLVVGRLEETPVAVMAGRVHLYEGYSPQEVVFGVRLLGKWGARVLVLTNASGGIHPALEGGRLALIRDHINLQGSNPLTGRDAVTFGPRFPDLSDAYSPRCRRLAREAAAELGLELFEAVYAAVLGPSYETPAEIRFLRAIGADLVGMSTAAEVIAARQMGLEVLAISLVTNMAAGISPAPIRHEEVLAQGERLRSTLARLLKAVLPRL